MSKTAEMNGEILCNDLKGDTYCLKDRSYRKQISPCRIKSQITWLLKQTHWITLLPKPLWQPFLKVIRWMSGNVQNKWEEKTEGSKMWCWERQKQYLFSTTKKDCRDHGDTSSMPWEKSQVKVRENRSKCSFIPLLQFCYCPCVKKPSLSG